MAFDKFNIDKFKISFIKHEKEVRRPSSPLVHNLILFQNSVEYSLLFQIKLLL